MKHRVCAEQLFYRSRSHFFFSLRILHVTVNIVRFALFYVSYKWHPFSFTLLHLVSSLSAHQCSVVFAFVDILVSLPWRQVNTYYLRRQLSYAQFVIVCLCVISQFVCTCVCARVFACIYKYVCSLFSVLFLFRVLVVWCGGCSRCYAHYRSDDRCNVVSFNIPQTPRVHHDSNSPRTSFLFFSSLHMCILIYLHPHTTGVISALVEAVACHPRLLDRPSNININSTTDIHICIYIYRFVYMYSVYQSKESRINDISMQQEKRRPGVSL